MCWVLELQGALQVGDHLEAPDVDPPHSLGANDAVDDGYQVDSVES